jgi:DUF971 family protein
MTVLPQTNPTNIKFRKQSQQLEISYANGEEFSLNSEFLRVHSPSAEVRGHGAGQETLQTGKLKVEITELIPVGNYALQLVFSDGAPSELGDAVDSNAAMRKKKRSGAKASLGRGKTGTQVYGGASGSGLKIK